MKRRDIASIAKNAMGTVFLLAGAFFVCSTFLSMRAVLADPIAPTVSPVQSNASPRANSTSRASGRTVNRGVSNATVARTTGRVAGTTNASRGIVSRATTNAASRASASATSRATGANANRNVVSRATTRTNSRNVVARTATDQSRVGTGNNPVTVGNRASAKTYTYLSSKLYTGNYSNIVDSSTGLISVDAYNNCMESYYACMDEICTARNTAQRRCACAGRVRAFAEAETALESANEELIKVAGELALLVANKGKDVSDAFQLTDAEKVMNCVSWQEVKTKYGSNSDEVKDWCADHMFYGENGAKVACSPSYCKSNGNSFGFDISNIEGSSSDILASLQSWADAKEQTITILKSDDDAILDAASILNTTINGLSGIDGAFASSDEIKDSLAETWGYELFEYAHNNVCARVLDTCFNGIYEACGTPPSGGRKCTNGASQCPYNYNSKITVNNSGTYELNFVTPNTGYTSSNSATCFGYTTSSGDPYSSLRGPVADARRSIMQKYALDANADCDLYGEQLRKTAQNIGYQKAAAQQALQQKRLEFANEERDTVRAEAVTAGSNFDECISEILDCYETQSTNTTSSGAKWTDSRIKTYCAQISNVPHCYETMICNPSTAQFRAVIDKQDSNQCLNSQDYTKNTCRNIVTLNEILRGTGENAASIPSGSTGSSAALREFCLQENGITEIRGWSRLDGGSTACTAAQLYKKDTHASSGYNSANFADETTCENVTGCVTGYMLNSNNVCVLAQTDCSSEIVGAAVASRTLNGNTWSNCILTSCKENYTKNGNTCVADTRECPASAANAIHAASGNQTWTGTDWGTCVATSCLANYVQSGDVCVAKTRECPSDIKSAYHVRKATQTWNGSSWGRCIATECKDNWVLRDDWCCASASESQICEIPAFWDSSWGE